MHIIEITLEMAFGNSSHWVFQERDLHVKHFPSSITSAGDFCLGEPADMSPIAAGGSELLSPVKLPN